MITEFLSVLEFAPMNDEFRAVVNVILERAIKRGNRRKSTLVRLQSEIMATKDLNPKLLCEIMIKVAEALGETV